MRINDWSADVCSSDLVRRIAFTEQLVIGDILDAAEQAVVPIDVPIGLGEPRGQRAAGKPVLGGEGKHRRQPAFGIMDACGGACFRSEEHTSELQSLMRISYAVFCLKKKKTIDKGTQLNKKKIK